LQERNKKNKQTNKQKTGGFLAQTGTARAGYYNFLWETKEDCLLGTGFFCTSDNSTSS
jgi:hypothetical protein